MALRKRSLSHDVAARVVVSSSPPCKTLPMHNPRLHFDRHRRLTALDVFRGISATLMILTSNLAPAWPSFRTSPWNGLRLADCIQPFYLYIVGVSIVLSMAKYHTKSNGHALKSAIIRSLKLFIIGLLTEGSLSIGDYNLSTIRILGVLQRIGICYLFGVILELFLPPKFRFDFTLTPDNSHDDLSRNLNPNKNRHQNNNQNHIRRSETSHRGFLSRFTQSVAIFQMYKSHYIVMLLLLSSYIAILIGIKTPNQFGELCGRHIMSPVCNPMSFIDQQILTVDHMLFPINGHCSFQRMDECNINNAMNNDKNQSLPIWCQKTPFEPFGISSTLTATLTMMIGMHSGHLMIHFGDHSVRILHLCTLGALQLIIGICLHFSDLNQLNANLYSISYLLITASIAQIIMASLYGIVDVKVIKYRHRKRYKKEQRQLMADHLRSTYFIAPHLVVSPKKSVNGSTIDTIHKKQSGSSVTVLREEEEEETYVTVDDEDESKSDGMNSSISSIALSDDSIESCCPFWCCCCCEDLPCARWDCKMINVMDKVMVQPLEALGRNAFLVYLLAQSGVTQWILSMFYVEEPRNNLVNILYPTGVFWGPKVPDDSIASAFQSAKTTASHSNICLLLWSVGYIFVWMALCLYLHHRLKRYFII